MHDAPTVPLLADPRPAEQPTLPTTQPELAELFAFMAEAELRFDSLRVRIVDRRITTHGEEVKAHDVWLRHPRQAKVVTSRGETRDRDYEVWLSDGETVQTFDAQGNTATRRRLPVRPVGADAADLPGFARVYVPATPLPAESVADTFVHPHGFCRNVLATGVVTRRGTAEIAGREVILLRSDHPRTGHVLNDRPDHWLEVGIDLQTGMLLLLAEHVGDQMTRHSEATSVGINEPIPDGAFTLHLSADVRTLY